MSESDPSSASEPEQPAPESVDVLTADRKQRRARMLVAGTVLVLGIGGGYGLVRYQSAQNEKAVATAWSSFSRCLTGGDLAEGERPSQRFRNLQLVAMTMTDPERTFEGSDKTWPNSCAPLGHALNTAGVFRADTGERVDSIYSYGGYARKDGSSAVLGYNGRTHDLLITRRTASGTTPRVKIEVDFELGNLYYSSQLLWDAMILRGVTRNDERKLFAATLDFHGEPFKDLGAVGNLPEPGLISGGADEPPHIAGCRTDKAMVVRVKGYSTDFMSFLIGSKWTPPIAPNLTGGILSCHGTEAVITRLEPAGEGRAWKTSVTQCLCNSAGCRDERATMEKILKGRYEHGPRDMHVDAVDLDGKLLLVWAAGERGGVRMRLAKAAEIERAPDVILFDDMVKDGAVGKLSTLFDLRLFSRDGFAILLMNTVAGIHALRIDPGGNVAPVTVKWDAG